jgi:hypothetical protein
MMQTLKQQKEWENLLAAASPPCPSKTTAVHSAHCHWVPGACTDALAHICLAMAPSTDDVGLDDELQPNFLSASWAALNYFTCLLLLLATTLPS